MIEQQENITLGAHDTRDGVGIVGRRTQRAIVTPAEIQSLPQFVAYFRPAYDAPTAKVIFEPVPTTATAAKFIPYNGNGFDEGGMRVSALNVEIREGTALVEGFASLDADEQKTEFFRWLDRVRPDGSAGIEAERNQSERDWYWQHFATARVRGLFAKEIAPPDPYAGFAGNGTNQQRETAFIPYPGTLPASPPHALVEEPVTPDASDEVDQGLLETGHQQPALPLSVRAHPAIGQVQPVRTLPSRPAPPVKAPVQPSAANALMALEKTIREDS